MRKSIVRSVLVTAILAVGSATVSAQSPTTSPAFADQFTAAQKAKDAKRWPEVIAKANEVLSSSKARKPDDVYAAHYFLLEAAKGQNNTNAIIQSLEGILNSGFALGPAQNQYRKALMTAYYQQKNYPQAVKHGTDIIKAGAADDDVYTVVGQAYYQQKAYGEAVKLFSGLVESDEKAGRRPERNKLVLLQSSYDKAGNAEAAQATLEKLVRYYPDPKTWLALLYDVKRDAREPRQKLQLYRLMESTGNLSQATDFTAYSDSAMGLGLYAEAARVIQAAQKAKVYTNADELARSERYLKSNLERADQAKADLGKVQAEAKSAPTGNELVALGMQQLSFEQYPQAVESLKAGIAKGGLKNPADAQLTLGVAQVKAGQKADAGKTFRAIDTTDETTGRIAKFWALHAG
jgi:tetratricopeptide (TPR) repeat protein